MAKTKADVVARAHRVLGVLAVDENPTADMVSFAEDTLDGVYEELQDVQGLHLTWSLDDVPDGAFLPLADMLAAHIAPHYAVQGPVRSRAITRIRAYSAQDDR